MKILLIAGHGAGDPGASGCGYREADLTREVVIKLADMLKDYAEIDVYPINRNAYYDVNRGNLAVNWKEYNYVFEIHFNSFDGNAKGTEIYVTRDEESTNCEEKIMEKLSQFFTIRGVKKKNFSVIYSARRSGISSALLETCFIDNQEDIDTYNKNKDNIVQAIANGIIEGFGLIPAKLPDLRYDVHIQDEGWTGPINEGEVAGTEGECKRIEAVKMEGNNGLEIEYRVHMEDLGWSDWKKSGEIAGTTGQCRRIEALEINSNKPLEAQEHVQDIGWMPSSKGTHIKIGTEGKALRLEAFKIKVM